MEETKRPIFWNVKNNRRTKDIIETVLSNTADVMANTLGPYGDDSIIESSGLDHHTSKDGYSILSKIIIQENSYSTILKMLKSIATELHLKVGDGTTSSVVSSYYLYKELEKIKENVGIRSKEMLERVKHLNDLIESELKLNSKKVSDNLDELKYIAAVATNNDIKIGEYVQRVYKEVGKYGFINLKSSKNENTHYTKLEGYRADAYLIDPILINNIVDKKSILKDAKVLMSDGGMGGDNLDLIISTITSQIEVHNNNLVIIAPYYDEDVRAFFKQLFLNNRETNLNKKLSIIQFPFTGPVSQDCFEDLVLLTGSQCIRESLNEKVETSEIEKRLGFVGECESKCTYNGTALFSGFGAIEQNRTILDDRILVLEKEIAEVREANKENLTENMVVFDMSKRLSNLKGGNIITVYVGGKSEMEKESSKYLYDDAIRACKSAIEYGYNLGQNLAIPIAIKVLLDKKMLDDIDRSILKAISNAFKKVFMTICSNKNKEHYNINNNTNIIELINCYDVESNKIDDTSSVLYEDLKSFASKFNEAVETAKTYNLLTNELSNDIINSTRTDIEILKANLSIMTLILNSNQMINVVAMDVLEFK